MLDDFPSYNSTHLRLTAAERTLPTSLSQVSHGLTALIDDANTVFARRDETKGRFGHEPMVTHSRLDALGLGYWNTSLPVCGYSWLTSSARRLSVSKVTPEPGEADINSSPAAEIEPRKYTRSPRFETLLQCALSFDFGLLSQVRS
jgi:hypothetical protein